MVYGDSLFLEITKKECVNERQVTPLVSKNLELRNIARPS